MQTKRSRTLLLLSLAGLVVASIGLALADSSRRPAAPTASKAAPPLDCKALEARLRSCAAHVATTVDPEVPDRLARMAPALRGAVLTVMADELQSRVGGACAQSRGRIAQGAEVASCLSRADAAEKVSCPASGPQASGEACTTWRKGQACEAFAACLKTAYATLPGAAAPRDAKPRDAAPRDAAPRDAAPPRP